MIFLRFALALILITTASSCTLPGTQDESEVSVDNTTIYEDSRISIRLPKTWSWAASNTLPPPRKGEVILTSLSPDAKSGYANNLIILKDTLERAITSSKYSELNHLQTVKNYFEYKKIADEILTFEDDETTRVYFFEARYNQSTPRMKFIQTARVCGTTVYLLHFTISPEKDHRIYTELLRSFTCK